MKTVICTVALLFFNLFLVKAQNHFCPPNFDFEMGDFSSWECSTGSTASMGGNNTINLTPGPPAPGRHELMDSVSGGLDPYGNFPVVCPYGGGRYSVRLGNDNTGKGAEGISYTFQIPPNADTFSITYYYAVVFEDPDHDLEEQPRFFVTAYDIVSGAIIDCASYNYVSTASLPGFRHSSLGFDVLYKDWTPASIDFSGLSGRQVRLEFKTADCTLGGHFGYAYLDIGRNCGGVIATAAYCISTNNVILNAPYGFQNYVWYDSTYSTVIGTTQSITLSPPPTVNTWFHVDMVPYPGYGCRDTADAITTVLYVPDTIKGPAQVYYCQYDYAANLDIKPDYGNFILWYNNATGGIPSTIPPASLSSTLGSVDYYLSQKSFFGCESPRRKITITVLPNPVISFSINNQRQCLNGNNFIFGNTSTNLVPSSTYQWIFGDADTAYGFNSSHIYNSAGYYTVTLVIKNPSGCNRELSKTIVVISKPAATILDLPTICENQTLIALQSYSTGDQGIGGINSWWWQIGSSTTTNEFPAAFTASGGAIPVKLVVTTVEGCRSDTTIKIVDVHFSPLAKFDFPKQVCDNEVVHFMDLSFLPPSGTGDIVNNWSWWVDNAAFSNLQHPSTVLSMGSHHVKLIALSDKGCKSQYADCILFVKQNPAISLRISDSCVFRDIFYTAGFNSPFAVDKWYWDFGTGLNEDSAVQVRKFYKAGFNPVRLIALSSNQCRDTIYRPFTIYHNQAKAEQDTLVAFDEPTQLHTSAAIDISQYNWTPYTGLNDPTIGNPVAIAHDKDMVYELNTMSIQGCESYSKILVKRYIGPSLFVPSAFSPNMDGLNDLLRLLPVGLSRFNYFSVYNRSGNLVFTTGNYHEGWDGTYKGLRSDPGNYVWMAQGIDYRGRVIFRKGNVVLLR